MTVDVMGLLGPVIVLWAVIEVWVTVLHPDSEGMIATAIRRAVWSLATMGQARLRTSGSRLLALAGPIIIALTFVAWVGVLILGVAVMVWAELTDFTAHEELGPLTFLDALYFAGGTVTVLGYGDITPSSGDGQLLAVVVAALGFTLFTGMATYLIEIVNGVSTRNRFTLAVDDDMRDAGGVTMVADSLAEDGVTVVRTRCEAWASQLRAVDEMVHRYPLVAFTYRSQRREYDPETALRHLSEAAVTLLAATGFERGLHTATAALVSAITRLQGTIADKYLPDKIGTQLLDPSPKERDREAAARVRRLLTERLGAAPERETPDAAMADLVFRSRVFLSGMHRWSRTDSNPHEWDG